MTKEQFQKELKEKIKPGVKPSKLKKSKSDGDLPQIKTQPLKKSSSQLEIPSAPTSPTTKIKELEDKITSLQDELNIERKKVDLLREDLSKEQEKNKELKKNPPNLLLTDQLQTKQKELEKLRAHLEETSSELTTLKKEKSNLLDTNLELKHQSLKDWWKQYQKNQALEQELKENIDYASNELVEQDKVISDLQSQVRKLTLTNQSLTKDLNLTERLLELRKDYPNNSPTPSYWEYALYSLVAICFISLLNSSWNRNYG